MLTPEEQAEFSELDAEFGKKTGLTPEEQAEFEELDAIYGQAVPLGLPEETSEGIVQESGATVFPVDDDPQIESQSLSEPVRPADTMSSDQAMSMFDQAIQQEEEYLSSVEEPIGVDRQQLADDKDKPMLSDTLTDEEISIADEVEQSINKQLFGETPVHRLQRDLGVSADGVIGPNTRKAIVKKYGRSADKIIKAVRQQQRQEFEIITDKLAKQIAPDVGSNIKPEWIQAIWLHESAHGNKVLGGTYNLGNIKATKSQDGKTFNVWEHLDGKDVTVPAKFRTFKNFEAAAKGWLSFIKSARYKKAREASTFEEFLEGLGAYATDPKWVAGVTRALRGVEGNAGTS